MLGQILTTKRYEREAAMKETKEVPILRFKEEMEVFTGFDKGAGEFTDHSRIVVAMQLDGKEIGYIDRDGSITFHGDIIANKPTTIMSWGVTLTPAQRKEIDRKADDFQRKCDVEALVAACEEVMTLKQFPMVKDPPSEEPVSFIDDGVAVQLLKGTSHIGVIHSRGMEFGRLVMVYHVTHTGLTEVDRAVIVAKCREIVAAVTF